MKARILNGYRVVYKPNHPSAYTSENWKGWVYEHRYLMELELGRTLTDFEVCHHLDGNPQNNLMSNLIFLANQGMHSKLHQWIDAGSKMSDNYTPSDICGKYLNRRDIAYCTVCDITLQHKQETYCSNDCRAIATRRVERPTHDQLKTLLQTMSYVAVGKMYGVSDNAIRKWLKAA